MGFRPDAAASRRLTGLRGLLSLILACLAFFQSGKRFGQLKHRNAL